MGGVEVRKVRDKRINFVQLSANCGISVARNVGLSLARGEFIAVMDSDDVALPQRLLSQVAFMEKRPELHVAGTGIIKEIGADRIEQIHPASDEEIKARLLLLDGSAMIHPTTMMRSSFLRENNIKYGKVELSV